MAYPSYSVWPPIRPIRGPTVEDPMQQLRNAQTVNMSSELFEKLFLSRQDYVPPQQQARWSVDDLKVPEEKDWRKSLGNPTPM